MKTRITILAEDDTPTAEAKAHGLTEDFIKKAWQLLFDAMVLKSDGSDKATVISVEILEDE